MNITLIKIYFEYDEHAGRTSSELSPQSSTISHKRSKSTHEPRVHLNSEPVHVLFVSGNAQLLNEISSIANHPVFACDTEPSKRI